MRMAISAHMLTHQRNLPDILKDHKAQSEFAQAQALMFTFGLLYGHARMQARAVPCASCESMRRERRGVGPEAHWPGVGPHVWPLLAPCLLLAARRVLREGLLEGARKV